MNEKIYYNEDFPEGVEPLYNGNIADVYYSAHDSAHFRLSYDGLNRLTASQQYTRDGVKTAAAEAFTYDKMGNITSIVRSTQNPQPDYINRVQLFYDGNRIIRGEGSPYYGDYNDIVYPNYSGRDIEYEYDPNGNLIKNSDNRISLTTYNLLNLPQTVAFSDRSLSVFYYMADGRKIRNATGAYSISTAVPIDSVVKNTDPYISYMSEWNDVYWYQRTQQKYINTPEGNIEVSTGRKMSFSYYYTSKDHLGSIWLYWNSLSNKYSNIYYPSGIMREKRRSPFNYGLTGKEIVYDNGLDEYFFGARTLFAPINRFNQPDPLCEEYYHISPYAYCANNFINTLDPDGRSTWVIANKNGTYTILGGSLKDNDLNIYALSAGKNGEIIKKSIGMTTSITSFYDSYANNGSGAWAVGSIIDPKDNSGKVFLNNLVKDDPEIGYYMDNAKKGQKYDFKVTNGGNIPIPDINEYRGMPIGSTKNGQTIYTSAKDIGNIAAGYVAGIHAIPWSLVRKEFDNLQSIQDNRPSIELPSSQNAQYFGYQLGIRDLLIAPFSILDRYTRSIPTLYKRLTKQL